jgi:hypothetical protein
MVRHRTTPPRVRSAFAGMIAGYHAKMGRFWPGKVTPMPGNTPPVDVGNRLLGECAAELQTGLVKTPRGERMTVTIRTPSTTVTVFLDQPTGQQWSDQFRGTVRRFSSGGLVVVEEGMNGHG